jgi:ketosteroid isomerase-like protein
MESLLADDFVITVEDGSTFSKSGYIAHNADSALHVEISDMAEIKVRMHGNVAVVTAAYHEKGTSKGNLYESRDRATDVWMRNANGGWQGIAAHYSIPARRRFAFHGSHPWGTATAKWKEFPLFART